MRPDLKLVPKANKLEWAVAKDEPRVHYAMVGPWLFVIRPYTTNRFVAFTQRVAWEKSRENLFRDLASAKAWLEREAAEMTSNGAKM